MKRIELMIKGKLIYQSDEDLDEKDITDKALVSLLNAEIRANELGNPRLHFWMGTSLDGLIKKAKELKNLTRNGNWYEEAEKIVDSLAEEG